MAYRPGVEPLTAAQPSGGGQSPPH